jgi:S1-C subfamily serine protease
MKSFLLKIQNKLQGNEHLPNKTIPAKLSPSSLTTSKNIVRKGLNLKWLSFTLFIPSIFCIEIFREIPNCLKFLTDVRSNLRYPTTNVTGKSADPVISNPSKIQIRISEDKIKANAEKIAVKIIISEKASSSNGSGIIFKKTSIQPIGNNTHKYTYFVLTNNHILPKVPQSKLSSKIFTFDKKEHGGKLIEIPQSLNEYDLKIISFESDREYAVATIAKPVQIPQWDRVYIFGYPCSDGNCNSHKFIAGNVGMMNLLPNSITLTKGYSFPYTNDTESGMSGSPVLNSNAEVVAIHGLGQNAEEPVSAGKDSPYLLSRNNSEIPVEKKEIAKLFSWGIDLTKIMQKLSVDLK